MAKKEECVYCKFLKKSSYGQLRCAFFACKPQFDGIECRRFCKIADDDNPPSIINPNEEEVVKPEVKQEPVREKEQTETYQVQLNSSWSYIRSSFWLNLLVIFLLGNAIFADLGWGPNRSLQGRLALYINLLRLGEEFVEITTCVLSLASWIAMIFVYNRMKKLTKPYSSRFKSCIKCYMGSPSRKDDAERYNLFELLEFYQIGFIAIIIAYIILSALDYEWNIAIFLIFTAIIVLMINVFTCGVKLLKLKLKAFGIWMIVYSIVQLIVLIDVVEILVEGSIIGDSYTVDMITTIFEIVFVFVYFKVEEDNLKTVLSELKPDDNLNE